MSRGSCQGKHRDEKIIQLIVAVGIGELSIGISSRVHGHGAQGAERLISCETAP